MAATALAARISHRNQGRQRQESLVARLLRESLIEEAEVEQLRVRLCRCVPGPPPLCHSCPPGLLGLLARLAGSPLPAAAALARATALAGSHFLLLAPQPGSGFL